MALSEAARKWLSKNHSLGSSLEKWVLRGVVDRVRYKRGLVSRQWIRKIRSHNRAAGDKLRVGFGPLVTGEHELHTRKYRIDPMVDHLNKNSCYVADIFFTGDDLSRFDIVVVSKDYENINLKSLRYGACLIYDIVDKRYVIEGKEIVDMFFNDRVFECSYRRFIELSDAVILSSPEQEQDLLGYGGIRALIEHPVINDECKQDYRVRDEVKLIWQGYIENQSIMEDLHDVVSSVSSDTGRKLRVIYSTNVPTRDYGTVSFRKWQLGDWQSILACADIGIVVKPEGDRAQQRKPANKVLSYMAAGLPVVCAPTPADELVMEHGVTGFFARSREEWYSYLRLLVESQDLREFVGRRARAHAVDGFSVSKIGEKYVDLLNEVACRSLNKGCFRNVDEFGG